jgi:hypothetical protein
VGTKALGPSCGWSAPLPVKPSSDWLGYYYYGEGRGFHLCGIVLLCSRERELKNSKKTKKKTRGRSWLIKKYGKLASL